MTRNNPLLLPYHGTSPDLGGPILSAGPGSAVLGRATVGAGLILGARAVIRADGHFVRIGDDFHLGDRSTVHIAHNVYPTVIGSGVTAGRNTVVHACTVGDRCCFGDDVTILDGSEIGDDAAFGDGAVVFPGTVLDGGWLYEGMPAKPVRKLERAELEALHADVRGRSDTDGPSDRPDSPEGALFIAATARLAGTVRFAGGNGVWFGCDLDAGAHVMTVGENTNIQDNSILCCRESDVRIGAESTLGHNVTLTDAIVGDRSLIGIGAVIAPGTVVGDDVLVAAGARTSEGQQLEPGSFYAGNPAVRRGALDDRKRGIIASTWPTYCEYARDFADAQSKGLAEQNPGG